MILLVGNKSTQQPSIKLACDLTLHPADVAEKRAVTTAEGQEFATKHELLFIETSYVLFLDTLAVGSQCAAGQRLAMGWTAPSRIVVTSSLIASQGGYCHQYELQQNCELWYAPPPPS